MLNIAINIVPSIVRALGVLLAYKIVSTVGGQDNLIKYTLLASVASLANALALGGGVNYIIGLIVKHGYMPLRINNIIILSLSGFFVGVIFSLTLIFFSKNIINYADGLIVFFISYIFYTLYSYYSAIMLGSFKSKEHAIYSAGGGFFYVFLLLTLYFFDSITNLMAVTGYSVGVGISALVLLCTKKTVFKNPRKISVRPTGAIKFIAPSIISALLSPFFINAIITTSTEINADFGVGIVVGFRFTDIISIISAPIVSSWIFPRICGWSNDIKKIKYLVGGYLLILILVLFGGAVLFACRYFIADILFGDYTMLPSGLFVVFFIVESFRLAMAIFGLSLIDAGKFKEYFIAEIISKGVFVLLSNMFYDVIKFDELIILYAVCVLSASMYMFFCITKGRISEIFNFKN